VDDRYLLALAQQHRESGPAAPLPCPDCGSTDPCEHDKAESA
jgi:hypothetical protein